MTDSSSFLSDFVRGIAAVAAEPEDECLIERHSAHQQSLSPQLHLHYRARQDWETFMDTACGGLSQAA